MWARIMIWEHYNGISRESYVCLLQWGLGVVGNKFYFTFTLEWSNYFMECNNVLEPMWTYISIYYFANKREELITFGAIFPYEHIITHAIKHWTVGRSFMKKEHNCREPYYGVNVACNIRIWSHDTCSHTYHIGRKHFFILNRHTLPFSHVNCRKKTLESYYKFFYSKHWML